MVTKVESGFRLAFSLPNAVDESHGKLVLLVLVIKYELVSKCHQLNLLVLQYTQLLLVNLL